MNTLLPLLVFSDLDGTLLDHSDYSWQAAIPGLQRVKQLGAGLVLASSKTAAEIDVLKAEIGFPDWPSIVENGAGIVWPGQGGAVDDTDYQAIRAALGGLPKGFHGFGDMPETEVSQVTGLSLAAARLAKTRQYSEPGIWTGPQESLAQFLQALPEYGLRAQKGGRFLTLSFGRSKADALKEVVAELKPDRTIALGDAPNDIEMLEAADQGVIVKNTASPHLPPLHSETEGRTVRTTLEGPAGWAEAILALTAEIQDE